MFGYHLVAAEFICRALEHYNVARWADQGHLQQDIETRWLSIPKLM